MSLRFLFKQRRRSEVGKCLWCKGSGVVYLISYGKTMCMNCKGTGTDDKKVGYIRKERNSQNDDKSANNSLV